MEHNVNNLRDGISAVYAKRRHRYPPKYQMLAKQCVTDLQQTLKARSAVATFDDDFSDDSSATKNPKEQRVQKLGLTADTVKQQFAAWMEGGAAIRYFRDEITSEQAAANKVVITESNKKKNEQEKEQGLSVFKLEADGGVVKKAANSSSAGIKMMNKGTADSTTASTKMASTSTSKGKAGSSGAASSSSGMKKAKEVKKSASSEKKMKGAKGSSKSMASASKNKAPAMGSKMGSSSSKPKSSTSMSKNKMGSLAAMKKAGKKAAMNSFSATSFAPATRAHTAACSTSTKSTFLFFSGAEEVSSSEEEEDLDFPAETGIILGASSSSAQKPRTASSSQLPQQRSSLQRVPIAKTVAKTSAFPAKNPNDNMVAGAHQGVPASSSSSFSTNAAYGGLGPIMNLQERNPDLYNANNATSSPSTAIQPIQTINGQVRHFCLLCGANFRSQNTLRRHVCPKANEEAGQARMNLLDTARKIHLLPERGRLEEAQLHPAATTASGAKMLLTESRASRPDGTVQDMGVYRAKTSSRSSHRAHGHFYPTAGGGAGISSSGAPAPGSTSAGSRFSLSDQAGNTNMTEQLDRKMVEAFGNLKIKFKTEHDVRTHHQKDKQSAKKKSQAADFLRQNVVHLDDFQATSDDEHHMDEKSDPLYQKMITNQHRVSITNSSGGVSGGSPPRHEATAGSTKSTSSSVKVSSTSSKQHATSSSPPAKELPEFWKQKPSALEQHVQNKASGGSSPLTDLQKEKWTINLVSPLLEKTRKLEAHVPSYQLTGTAAATGRTSLSGKMNAETSSPKGGATAVVAVSSSSPQRDSTGSTGGRTSVLKHQATSSSGGRDSRTSLVQVVATTKNAAPSRDGVETKRDSLRSSGSRGSTSSSPASSPKMLNQKLQAAGKKEKFVSTGITAARPGTTSTQSPKVDNKSPRLQLYKRPRISVELPHMSEAEEKKLMQELALEAEQSLRDAKKGKQKNMVRDENYSPAEAKKRRKMRDASEQASLQKVISTIAASTGVATNAGETTATEPPSDQPYKKKMKATGGGTATASSSGGTAISKTGAAAAQQSLSLLSPAMVAVSEEKVWYMFCQLLLDNMREAHYVAVFCLTKEFAHTWSLHYSVEMLFDLLLQKKTFAPRIANSSGATGGGTAFNANKGGEEQDVESGNYTRGELCHQYLQPGTASAQLHALAFLAQWFVAPAVLRFESAERSKFEKTRATASSKNASKAFVNGRSSSKLEEEAENDQQSPAFGSYSLKRQRSHSQKDEEDVTGNSGMNRKSSKHSLFSSDEDEAGQSGSHQMTKKRAVSPLNFDGGGNIKSLPASGDPHTKPPLSPRSLALQAHAMTAVMDDLSPVPQYQGLAPSVQLELKKSAAVTPLLQHQLSPRGLQTTLKEEMRTMTSPRTSQAIRDELVMNNRTTGASPGRAATYSTEMNKSSNTSTNALVPTSTRAAPGGSTAAPGGGGGSPSRLMTVSPKRDAPTGFSPAKTRPFNEFDQSWQFGVGHAMRWNLTHKDSPMKNPWLATVPIKLSTFDQSVPMSTTASRQASPQLRQTAFSSPVPQNKANPSSPGGILFQAMENSQSPSRRDTPSVSPINSPRSVLGSGAVAGTTTTGGVNKNNSMMMLKQSSPRPSPRLSKSPTIRPGQIAAEVITQNNKQKWQKFYFETVLECDKNLKFENQKVDGTQAEGADASTSTSIKAVNIESVEKYFKHLVCLDQCEQYLLPFKYQQGNKVDAFSASKQPLVEAYDAAIANGNGLFLLDKYLIQHSSSPAVLALILLHCPWTVVSNKTKHAMAQLNVDHAEKNNSLATSRFFAYIKFILKKYPDLKHGTIGSSLENWTRIETSNASPRAFQVQPRSSKQIQPNDLRLLKSAITASLSAFAHLCPEERALLKHFCQAEVDELPAGFEIPRKFFAAGAGSSGKGNYAGSALTNDDVQWEAIKVFSLQINPSGGNGH
ncbi:unnamed protein product [Amoebophrya sp. A120]|nr:unnamed protein product [Amoebophrya sp. A120]|eukprot:GSA120T00017179001.1